jgi:hypothetical protein
MRVQLIKQYLLLLVFSILLFLLFLYLEKNTSVYFIQIDHKQDLSEQTKRLLQTIDGTLKFKVYTQKDTVVAKKIKKFFQAYFRLNKNLSIEFIDPIQNPTQVKQNSITMQGEILLSNVQGKQVHITELSESAISNALVRLNHDIDEWIVFAQGYGMLQIDDSSNQGLSHLLFHLKKLGFHIARMPLNTALVLPENVKLIILPAPTETLDNDMISWLQAQLDAGISLMWLNDVGINKQMGLELLTDVVSSNKKAIQGNLFVGTSTQFPKHEITENFKQPLYLADAREIIAQTPQTAQILLQSQDKSSLALTKQLDKARVIVIGDSDFVNNQYLNLAANKSFIVRVIDWLLYHDDRINVAAQVNTNTQLLLSQTQLLILSVVFLILLPLIFLIIAFKQWRSGRV